MCQHHHPPPGSVTRGCEWRDKKQREEGKMYGDGVKENGEEVCMCVCVLLLECISATSACVALLL